MVSGENSIKKIAIFIPNLKGGGAEIVFVNLSHAFKRSGYEVDFVLLKKEGVLLEQLPEGIGIVDLNTKRIRNSFSPLLRYLKNNKPDVLIAVMWPLTIIATIVHRISGLKKSGCRVILSDHNTMSISTKKNGFLNKVFLQLSIHFFYPLADKSLAVSQGVLEDIKKLSRLPNMDIDVILNPVVLNDSVFENDKKDFYPKQHQYRILTVGSLKAQKNHALLIKAFSLIHKKIDADLIILGEGNLRKELEALIFELGLSERITLLGFKENPKYWYSSANLFVLSSDYEGLPMVLIEAISLGLPVVSTDCPSGPAEILESGKYGKLVPVGDVDALANAMLESLQEEHDVEALKARAADFNVDKIAKQYLDVMFPEDVFPEKEIH